MAVEELLALADEMARPFTDDARFSAPRKCMPQIDLVINDFRLFDRKLKSEISEMNKGDIFEALYDAQCDLTNDLYRQKVTWPLSDEAVEKMKTAIKSWWDRKHVGVACVLQTKLFLECPAMAMRHSVDFVKCRTQFMNDLSPLLWELGDTVPKSFQPGSSQLFLPSQLVQIPAITAHFIQCELPDSLGRSINHILIDAGTPVDWQPGNINRHDILGRTALYFACRDNDAIGAEQLLFANARVDICASNGLLPLHVAAIAGATSICEKICERRENVTSAPYDTDIRDGFGRSAFFWAVSFNHKDTATFFSSRIPSTSPSQDAHGFTAISVAASKGHQDMLQNLARNGFASDEPDFMGRSPLWYASRINSPNIMKFLDNEGALIDRKDIDGMAPVHIAAQTGSTAALEYLLSFNHHDEMWPGVYHWRVDLKAVNHCNQSPLVLAAAARHSSCVKQLAKHGRHALGEANVTHAAAISQQNGDTESFKTLVGLLNAFELITLSREPVLPFTQEAESTWQSNAFRTFL
jgi:ankyrin repeat protein